MFLGFIREGKSFASAVLLFLINFVFCAFVMCWPTWPWENRIHKKLEPRIPPACWVLTLAVVLYGVGDTTHSLWTLLVDIVWQCYSYLTAKFGLGFLPPAVPFTFILGTINYAFRRAEFAVLSTTKNLLIIYLIFMAVAYCFGIPAVMLLVFFSWIHMRMVTSATDGHTPAPTTPASTTPASTTPASTTTPAHDHGQTKKWKWFVKIFTVWAFMMRTCSSFSLLCVVSWLHDWYEPPDTDERKQVRTITGYEFVKKKSNFFICLFALTGLLTYAGQLRASTSSIAAPETISNVFCKNDNHSQIECLVNVTYYDPAASDTEKCFCDFHSHRWDFCGSFTLCC